MKIGLVVAFICLILLLVAVGPLAVIWALNTLFSLKIAYSFSTWLAVLILSLTFGKSSISLKNRSDS